MFLIHLWDVKTSLFFHYINIHWARHLDRPWGRNNRKTHSPYSHRAHSFWYLTISDKWMVVVNIETWHLFFTPFFTLPWITGTGRLETIFPRFPCQKSSRYSLGFADVNHNLTFVKQKKSISYPILSLE